MGAGPDQSIGHLVSTAIADVQTLVRDQVELTKLEVSKSAKQFGSSAGMLIGAGVLGLIGFIFLLVTAAYGLNAAGLSLWLSFLIVAVVVLIVAAILALLGKKKIDQAKVGPARAAKQLEQTRAALSGPLESVTGSAPSLPSQESTAR